MTYLILPLSTLYYAHEDVCRRDWLERFRELEVRRFDAGSIPQDLPLAYHLDRGIVSESFPDDLARNRVFENLARYNVQTFSFDLGPACSRSLSVFPLEPYLSRIQLTERFSCRVDLIRKRFSGRILLENLPYYRTGLYESVCDPGFIGEILERLDAGLLLDMAHAWCSADNLRIPRREYLERLPLHRVRQVHVSGVYRNEFLTVDAHNRPDRKELEETAGILRRLPHQNTGVAVEYYRDLAGLQSACDELAEILQMSP